MMGCSLFEYYRGWHKIRLRSYFLVLLATFMLLDNVIVESQVIAFQDDPYFDEINFVEYSILECVTLALDDIKSLSLYKPLFPSFTPYQEAVLINSSHPISEFIVDIHGNTIARIDFSDLSGVRELNISFNFEITKKVLQFTLSEDVGVYDQSPNLFKAYTLNETHIEAADPKIVDKAKEIVGYETNAYRMALSIFNWVQDYLEYEVQKEEMGALWALENGKGDCSEFSFLFTALCRAVGIPARVVSGISGSELLEGGFFSDWCDMGAHLWAEVYFPRYGWIWVDATWNQFADNDALHIAYIRTESAQYEREDCLYQVFSYYWHYKGDNVTLCNTTFQLTLSNIDSDLDGLTNVEEAKRGTNGFKPDTDGDFWSDSSDLWPTDPVLPDVPLIIIMVLIIFPVASWLKRKREEF